METCVIWNGDTLMPWSFMEFGDGANTVNV